jgi:hypothetical protein
MQITMTLTQQQLEALYSAVTGRVEDAEAYCVTDDPADDPDFASDASLRPIMEGLDALFANIEIENNPVEVVR